MNATIPAKRGRLALFLFRFFATLFGVGGLIMLEGLTEGLEPWFRSALAFDPHPEELRFHGAVHGALVGLLFSGSLFLLLWRPLRNPLLLHFYFVGHFIFLGTLVATGPLFALSRFSVFIMFGLTMGILFASYAGRRDIFRPSEPSVLNRPLLVMTGIALLGLLPFIVTGAIEQFKETEEQYRWGEGTALALTMLYGGWLTATARRGARPLGILIGLAYVYMGAASLALPEHEASWGIPGGIAAIAYGLVYGGMAFKLLRRSRELSAGAAAQQTN